MTTAQMALAVFNTMALVTLAWLVQSVYSRWREKHPRPVDPYLKSQLDRLLSTVHFRENKAYLEQWMVEVVQLYWNDVQENGSLHNRKDPNEDFRRVIFKHRFEPPHEEKAMKNIRIEFCKVIRSHRLRLKRKPQQYQSESSFASKVLSSIGNYQYK